MDAKPVATSALLPGEQRSLQQPQLGKKEPLIFSICEQKGLHVGHKVCQFCSFLGSKEKINGNFL